MQGETGRNWRLSSAGRETSPSQAPLSGGAFPLSCLAITFSAKVPLRGEGSFQEGFR